MNQIDFLLRNVRMRKLLQNFSKIHLSELKNELFILLEVREGCEIPFPSEMYAKIMESENFYFYL